MLEYSWRCECGTYNGGIALPPFSWLTALLGQRCRVCRRHYTIEQLREKMGS